MEPTPDNLTTYFPARTQPNFRAKKPHQRARLVRIAQVRDEMARVYNYMLRGFNAQYVQLQRDDFPEWKRLYPEGFTLSPDQAKACTAILKEIAALVHTQAIEAKLDMLRQRIQEIVKEQGLPTPEFLEDKPEPPPPDGEEPWASEEIEEREPEPVIEMEKNAEQD